jgi:RNA polymerase sigma factor (sigma-70 family)
VATDAELVAAALAGDREAFGLLVDRHRPRATAVVRRMLGDAEAEDVTQEALLRAHLDLRRLRNPDSFGGWLSGIAVNLAKMRLRAGHGSVLDRGGVPVPNELPIASDDPSPVEVAEARELLELVRGALEALPDRQRRVALMYYVDGLAAAEIAALLGTSTGAVRVGLHRARRRLRESLHIHDEEVRTMVEVRIEDVVVRVLAEDADAELPRLANERLRVVLLHEQGGERVLPIWVGAAEGDALALQLAGASMPRPLTADLMARLVETAGAQVERVLVNSLRENTFFATVVLSTREGERDVDARPSDAFNLALRTGARVYVDDEVMERCGSGLDLDKEAELVEEYTEDAIWRSLSVPLVMSLYPGPRPKGP